MLSKMFGDFDRFLQQRSPVYGSSIMHWAYIIYCQHTQKAQRFFFPPRAILWLVGLTHSRSGSCSSFPNFILWYLQQKVSYLYRSKVHANNLLEKHDYYLTHETSNGCSSLKANEYLWETSICRLYIACHPSKLNDFANSEIIRDNYIILQVIR